MEFSSLHPSDINAEYNTLPPQAVNDLSIDYICEFLTKDTFERNSMKNLMTSITSDERVIKYRTDVFDDLLRYPSFRTELEQLLLQLNDLKELEKFQKDTDASDLWTLINRLREIDGFVNCITQMKQSLEKIDLQSDGLKELRDIVTKVHDESGFPQIKKDIAETFAIAKQIRSITLGVNLDEMLRPTNAGIISLNCHLITDSGLLKSFMKFTSQKDELYTGTAFASLKNFHPQNPNSSKITAPTVGIEAPTGADQLSSNLTKTVTAIVKKIVKDIKSTLQKYINISGFTLVSLIPEIIFYIRWAELIEKIRACGLSLCKAKVLPAKDRLLYTTGIYNLKLALKAVEGEKIDIIGNDFEFSEKGRIYIMTGPNRGGKTTFTQAVGLACLLAHNGIYVPADSFSFSPCDNIFTHFPADENDTANLGRLGEESQRIADIFNKATDKSLLLFNESLATTNVAEGLYIAKDVVKAMLYIGTRTIFNTHMHELARNLDTLNNEIQGTSRAESLVTGVENGNRSFKVFIAPPQGVSYAKDIAVKYGVTFEQIKCNIDKSKQ